MTVAATLGLLVAGAGCKNPFIARHRILVDSIAAANVEKPNGKSYRLITRRSVATASPNQVAAVQACVDAALSGIAMFPAPAGSPPELFIEVGWGQDSTPRVDPAARETYLQLSGRSNPQRLLDQPTGSEEIWDTRVAVLGIAGRVESAIPVLASVAANYLATDTKLETKVEVPQNSPSIAAVRDTAIKALESSPPPRQTTAGGNAPAGGASPSSIIAPPVK